MSFAAFQALANASVLQHLANARVLIGGEDVPGIFRNPAQGVGLGIGAADSRPTVTVSSAAVTNDPVDTRIDIDGTPYMVGAAEPDGTGLTVLTVDRTQ